MSKENCNFLLVDDDELFLNTLTRALTRRGFSCRQAQTLQQAKEQLAATDFERALVDLKLGQESGLLVIKELHAAQPALQILMLTGYSSISTAVDAIKLGAVNYLCKPADLDEILAAFNTQAEPQLDIQSLMPPSVDRLEWEHIQRVLAQHQGNISATARALGMHRRTLQRKLQKRPVKQ